MARRGRIRAVMAVMGLVLLGGQAVSRADSQYPLQASNDFTIAGTLTAVDPERARLTLKASDGHVYAVDAYDTRIVIPERAQKAEVGDLVPGMQVRLKGYLLSRDIIAADQLSVLPLSTPGAAPARPRISGAAPGYSGNAGGAVPAAPQTAYGAAPAAPQTAYGAAPGRSQASPSATQRYYHPEPIRLRGTVESVDDAHGILSVRVRDHSRFVYVNSTTDLTDIQDVDDTHIGINAGDRITVRGLLRADGSVRATAISRSKNIDQVATKVERESDSDHLLIGQISKESDKFSNRNIKVQVRPGREVEVEVGHGIPIIRNGRKISVHDLTREDLVRVEGYYDGADFKADRIDVLRIDAAD